MSKIIYLINPAADFPTYFGAEVFAGRSLRPATLIADLSIATLAGMVSEDLDPILCDENISRVDFDCPADFVGITGKITQRGRMLKIAEEFRRRGKIVIIGGPYASLCPESLRPYCDILVRGEAEEIFGELCSDLKASCWKHEYVGGKPDLSLCAKPRWDLYPNQRALIGAVQTSRGCPFECEFCDVIQYLGRRQRRKPIAQVLAELDELYRFGYRSVFLADDNFTVASAQAKSLLEALRDWNHRQEKGRVNFITQASVDAAKDPELLQMCAAAGLTTVFIGIETPNEESLREAKKRQNLGVDLAEQIQRFLDCGIKVDAGMIVGFDSDGPDIFERQLRFASSVPVPVFSVGALVAPDATPLHDRMRKQGRLIPDGPEVAALPWSTNIEPKRMTRDQLLQGLKWLCNNLYNPSAFTARVSMFIDKLGAPLGSPSLNASAVSMGSRQVELDSMELIRKLGSLGRRETEMLSALLTNAARKPQAAQFVIGTLIQYAQIRYMYERGSWWDSFISPNAPIFAGQTNAALTSLSPQAEIPV